MANLLQMAGRWRLSHLWPTGLRGDAFSGSHLFDLSAAMWRSLETRRDEMAPL